MYVCANFCRVVIVIMIIIIPEDLWAILSGCDDENIFSRHFLVQLASRNGKRANYGSRYNGLWFMCKFFGRFCSGWATWCTRPSSDIGEWSKYHRECSRYEFLHFSVLFMSIPGCCFFFFFPGRRGQNPSSNSPEKRLRYIDWVIILKGF